MTPRLWISFGVWFLLAVGVANMLEREYSLPGGGFNGPLLFGTIIGSSVLWWAVMLMATGLIDYAKRR